MPNMSLKRNEMPTQNPSERSKNFKEVTPKNKPSTRLNVV